MVDGWSMVVEYKTIDHHITIIPTIHYTTLVVEWSIFKTSRVRARENSENHTPIPCDSSRYHPDHIPSIYKQYHVY